MTVTVEINNLAVDLDIAPETLYEYAMMRGYTNTITTTDEEGNQTEIPNPDPQTKFIVLDMQRMIQEFVDNHHRQQQEIENKRLYFQRLKELQDKHIQELRELKEELMPQ